MKIAITGALGHIGSRLIHSLQPGDFDEVLLLDNLSTQRQCSLFNLPAGVRFHFVECDVCDADLHALLSQAHAVVHLAAITDAARSFERPEEVERVNLIGTQRVAQACADLGCRLIFPSTTSVYGSQSAVVDESCGLEELKPQSPYAESKLHAEQHLASLHAKQGLRCMTLRLGTIFGVSIGMRFHTAVNKLTWQACLGLPLTVWRTALHQQRPYLELGDAVRALRFVIDRDLFDGRLFNVLSLNATVDDIVQVLRRHVPTLAVALVDSRIMNQLSYTVDCSRFRDLGFAFQGRLEQGIGETVEWLVGVHRG